MNYRFVLHERPYGPERYNGLPVHGRSSTPDTGAGVQEETRSHVELGNGLVAKGEANFLTPPAPQVNLREPPVVYHQDNEQQGRDWLARWNIRS
ncbi:hypothetical protein [Nocardia sp. NPDC051981]|uniref:hypothetical protein n=1 Tax=Nocardia sp. NPDC051981 TaxID=3155417 RepID=UPI00343383DD